jgi:hypothetical protein
MSVIELEKPQQLVSLIDMGSIRKAVGPQIDGTQSKGSQSAVQVRKTKKSEFIRIHPSEEQRLIGAYVIELSETKTREIYIITGDWAMPIDVEDFATPVNLLRAMNHIGTEFLYYYKNSTNDWALSASLAARQATEEWIRLRPNMGASCYDISVAPVGLPEPTWSNRTFQEMLTMAFQGRLISSPEHKVIRLLQGKSHELNR